MASRGWLVSFNTWWIMVWCNGIWQSVIMGQKLF